MHAAATRAATILRAKKLPRPIREAPVAVLLGPASTRLEWELAYTMADSILVAQPTDPPAEVILALSRLSLAGPIRLVVLGPRPIASAVVELAKHRATWPPPIDLLGGVRMRDRSRLLERAIAEARKRGANALYVQRRGLGPHQVELMGRLPITRANAVDRIVLESLERRGMVRLTARGWERA